MRILYFVIIVAQFGTQSCTSQTIIKEAGIKIYYVDYNMMTPYKITCKYFDDFFIKESDSIIISDKELTNKFTQFMSKLEYLENGPFPDIRQKIIIRDTNELEEMVLYSDGQSSMMMNDKPILFNDSLQILINELIIKQIKKNK